MSVAGQTPHSSASLSFEEVALTTGLGALNSLVREVKRRADEVKMEVTSARETWWYLDYLVIRK